MSDFICNECDSTFSNLGNLNKHMKTSKKCGKDKKSESFQVINLLREQFKSMEEMYKSKIKFLQDEEKELIKTLKEKISFLELQLKQKDKENFLSSRNSVQEVKESRSKVVVPIKEDESRGASFSYGKVEDEEKGPGYINPVHLVGQVFK